MGVGTGDGIELVARAGQQLAEVQRRQEENEAVQRFAFHGVPIMPTSAAPGKSVHTLRSPRLRFSPSKVSTGPDTA